MIRAKTAGLDVVLRLYYENPELGTKEIKQLFPTAGNNAIAKLKKIARDKMAERAIKSFRAHAVNTQVAYEAWGIDVEDAERRITKLKKLGLGG